MLIFYIALSLIVSFLCSLLESVILTVPTSYLQTLKKTRPKLFKLASDYKSDIEKPLASILSLNTVAHTIGAAGAGAQAQKLYGDEVLTIFSILLTLAILFLSEIIPKSIGANFWRELLPFSIRVLDPLIKITYPLVWISNKISLLFKKKKGPSISRDEFIAMAEIGLNEGVLKENEHNALKSLIQFKKLAIKEVLTTEEKVRGLDSDLRIKEAFFELDKTTFSRLLVFGTTKDDIRGYILRSTLQKAYIDHKTEKITKIMRPILISPSTTPLPDLMNQMLERREHISAIINSESGEFIGIVCLEDIIERLLNFDIFDELD